MAKIEGVRIKNFRVLKDVSIGKLGSEHDGSPLPPITVMIGKNGVGKTSLFDAFGFLSDCLKFGVETACDLNERGGFERLRSQGCKEGISFEIYYRENSSSKLISYELIINQSKQGGIYCEKEVLYEIIPPSNKVDNEIYGLLLMLEEGIGIAPQYRQMIDRKKKPQRRNKENTRQT